jgi:iron(III) transport system permease protein
LLLRPTGFETLATRVWTATADGAYAEAGPPALLLVVASFVPVYLWVVRPALRDRP